MCGIAGVLSRNQAISLDPTLQTMCMALRHRGPDDEGRTILALPDGWRLGLAHTRLSIIDLSSAGHQPMIDPNTGSAIVYNGEVYNHAAVRKSLGPDHYQSTSDTETILKSWMRDGESTLTQLRGMFAFALYDEPRQQFWLVRDRLGIKPLYVCQPDPQTLVFASEVRALLASGIVERKLHSAAVAAFLTFGAVTAPNTLLAGVNSLLPGACWRFDVSGASSRLAPVKNQYWRPHFASRSAPAMHYAEAVERVRPALLEAVSLRMVADVPVGVFLSGGIDSSSVVAALAAQGHRLKTLSVAFAEQDYDESRHARLVAKEFGAEHSELVLNPRQILDDWDEALAAYDQPSIDGLNTYFISRAALQAGVKVALSGVGGDELFAGYPYFRMLSRFENRWNRWLASAYYPLLCLVRPGATRTVKLGMLLNAGQSALGAYTGCRQVLSQVHRANLLGGSCQTLELVPTSLACELESAVANLDAVNRHSFLEIALYLANMLLRDMDQMSMAHSLEVREPLLDHVLVEALAGIPGRLKLNRGRSGCSKAMLVDALPVKLPNAILHRPKMGFVFPWEHWLRGELRSRVSAILYDASAAAAAGLNGQSVRRLWEDYLERKPGIRYTDVLSLAHLLHWVRRHRLLLATTMPNLQAHCSV